MPRPDPSHRDPDSPTATDGRSDPEAETGTTASGTPRTDRRTLLRGAAAAGVIAAAGCLGAVSLGDDDVVLDEPPGYDQLREGRDAGGIPYPIHGDELPEATVPAPNHDREVTTTEFTGDRHVLLTFLFTRCPNVCLILTGNLAQVQSSALDGGYDDEVALLPTTFDPEHDTGEVLHEYSRDRGANPDHESWYCLRPETPERAERVVGDTFGVFFDSLTPEEREELEMGPEMHFEHLSSIVLANADGYVERNYVGSDIPNPGALVDDVETLRRRW